MQFLSLLILIHTQLTTQLFEFVTSVQIWMKILLATWEMIDLQHRIMMHLWAQLAQLVKKDSSLHARRSNVHVNFHVVSKKELRTKREDHIKMFLLIPLPTPLTRIEAMPSEDQSALPLLQKGDLLFLSIGLNYDLFVARTSNWRLNWKPPTRSYVPLKAKWLN